MSAEKILHPVFFGLVLVMRIASVPTANISYLALAMYALLGRAHAIRALGLSWFFSMLSPGIGPEDVGLASVGRYLILAAAAASVFLHNRIFRSRTEIRISKSVAFTFLVGLFFIAHSVIFSPILDVSFLKSLTWMIAVVTLLSAWEGMKSEERKLLEKQIFYALVFLMLASLPLLGGSLGYLRNQTGFQGILNHPQAFGLTMALLSAWLGSQVFTRDRPSLNLMMLFFLAVVMIVLSATRTAGLAFLLGLGSALIAGSILAKKRLRDYLPGLHSIRVRWMLAGAVIILVLASPFWAPSISSYISKGTDNVTVASAYEESRGFLIDRMLSNIYDHPLRGIGFGLASDPSAMTVERDSVLGLPTGAAIEKGVTYLAVWEELGLFGFLLVLAWLWMVLRNSARCGEVTSLAICSTVLLLNFGESTLFSPGGMGMLSLILITWAASGRSKKLKKMVREDSSYYRESSLDFRRRGTH